MTKTAATVHELGRGRLNWDRHERVSDRYGTVALLDGETKITDMAMASTLVGKRGRLVVVIEETRQSGHIGDIARGIGPKTPNKGDRIVLCKSAGTFFTEACCGGRDVGIKPETKRGSDWLDPQALYSAHDQTVRLFFEEE